VAETADAGHPLGGGVPTPGLRWGFTAASLTWLLERHGLRVVSRRLRIRPWLRVVVRRTPAPS
jgi:CTP synthase (UTP-ammonia lyase)